MSLQGRHENRCAVHSKVKVGALIEDTDVAGAVQELSRTSRAAACVLDGDLDERVQSAAVTEETAAAIDAKGAGDESRWALGRDCGGRDVGG